MIQTGSLLVHGEVAAELYARRHHISSVPQVHVDEILRIEVGVLPPAYVEEVLAGYLHSSGVVDCESVGVQQVECLHKVKDQRGVEIRTLRFRYAQWFPVEPRVEELPGFINTPNYYTIVQHTTFH